MPGILWSRVRNYLFNKGLLKSTKAAAFVISAGNLTWGGTGKTTLISFLGSFLSEKGIRIAIISRGYRRKSRGIQLVSDGTQILSTPQIAGDEPYLLARKVPQAIVVVSRKRVEAFRFLEKYEPSVILMDDAFQHRQAHRDLDLVLMDASEDITQQRVIPFGKLREELGSLERADAVILMHADQANPKTLEWLESNFQKPVFPANYSPFCTEDLSGKRVAAFCGLGSPEHFFRLLRECGANIVLEKKFADHHSYTEDQIARLQKEAERTSAELLVTTEKDRVKIHPSWLKLPLSILRVELDLENPKEFCAWISEKCAFK